jgi:hypothetical protein
VAEQSSHEGAVILQFPLDRIRRARPQRQLKGSTPDGRVVSLASRLPLLALASGGGLPPAA